MGKNLDMPQYLTAKFIHDYLSVSKTTVYRMFDKGELPTVKIGRNRRVERDAFIKWLKEKEDTHVSGSV